MSKPNRTPFPTAQLANPEASEYFVDDTDGATLIEMPLLGDAPLTRKEEQRLAELEGVVHKALSDAIIKAWYALRDIQQARLYRQTHATFEAYAKERWDLARQTAYQYIAAAEVIDNVRNCGQKLIPQNEAQARALTKYRPEQQIEIWTATVDSVKNGKITARHIKHTAQRLYNEKVRQKVKKNRRILAKTAKISAAFRASVQAFYEQIDIEREAHWSHTSREEVTRQLRGILDALEANR